MRVKTKSPAIKRNNKNNPNTKSVVDNLGSGFVIALALRPGALYNCGFLGTVRCGMARVL
jgi:uncharacterized protein